MNNMYDAPHFCEVCAKSVRECTCVKCQKCGANMSRTYYGWCKFNKRWVKHDNVGIMKNENGEIYSLCRRCYNGDVE